MRSLSAALLGLFSWGVSAQTFTAPGALVVDDGTTLDLPISISGLDPANIDTTNFGLHSVCLTVMHTWLSDFEVSIVAPDGTTALLFSGIGWDTDSMNGTCLEQNAALSITQGEPPFAGSFRPMGPMGMVNNGQVGNGIWHLRVRDTYPFADEGTIVDFSLTFNTSPANYYTITNSDLPIVVINTFGNNIPNDPKILAAMGIIDNGPGNINHPSDPFNDYNDHIGIETRGNSSQQWAKKSYGFELWDAQGNEVEAGLLGMPPESDWILSANHSDKSLLNNPLTFDLWQRMGRYAPRWRHVNVFLNGAYVGVYVLMEKIKRDAERVDIARLQPADTSGDDLTGGYIIKLDWAAGSNAHAWTSPHAPPGADEQTTEFLVDYPNEVMPQQAAYIAAYTDSFETALIGPDFADPALGFRRYFDAAAAIDFFLVNELGRNVDGYRLSTFLYKDKDSNGGKLTMGPVWDFDLAFGNADYCAGSAVEGWAYRFADVCPSDGKLPPFWWQRLLEDSAFVGDLRCRWEHLRDNTLGVGRLHAWCDSMAAELQNGQGQNFTAWPILGEWVWPNPQPVPADYAGEITELKNWIADRWQWLDANLPGTCLNMGTAEPAPAPIAVWPNPFIDRVRLSGLGSGMTAPQVYDTWGRAVAVNARSTGASEWELSFAPDLPTGAYIVRHGLAGAPQRLVIVRSLP